MLLRMTNANCAMYGNTHYYKNQMNTTTIYTTANTANMANTTCTTNIGTKYSVSPISPFSPSTTNPFGIKENGINTNDQKKTIILLDFDDTLFPSTCFRNNNIDKKLFISYCHKAYELLTSLIIKYGSKNIYIISNATILWILECLKWLLLT